MKRIAITRADNQISILTVYNDEEVDRVVASWAFAADPEWLPFSYREVTEEHVEKARQDRDYRCALRDDGNDFYHDMEHAGQLHLDKLRAERKPKLEALDIEWMKTFHQGKDAGAIVEAKKQKLRDLPDVSKAQTLEELKAVTLPVIE